MEICWILSALLFVLCLPMVDFQDVPCETNIFLEVGKQGVVSCSFQDFELLAWINGNGSHGEATPFIYLENSEKKGKGYESGLYNIFPNGSLIINIVELKHEFNFTVLYSPPVGKQLYFYVPVKVFVPPDPEYPVVNGPSNQQSIVQIVEQYIGTINCSMYGVRPAVDLEWVYPPDVISLDNERSSITNNTDGTYNVFLSSHFTISDRAVLKITLQCRVVEEMAHLFPSVTTIYMLNMKEVEPFPVIDGCYSQQENCILVKSRDGNLTCSVQNIPSEYTMNINLDIFADDRSLSLTRINGDHHRHVSGDLTTSYQYTVDEDSTESVIQCTLSGTKNNQSFNSTATARITWQDIASDATSDTTLIWTLGIIIFVLIVIFTLLFIIGFLVLKTDCVRNAKCGFVQPRENEEDKTTEDRNSHLELTPLNQENKDGELMKERNSRQQSTPLKRQDGHSPSETATGSDDSAFESYHGEESFNVTSHEISCQ